MALNNLKVHSGTSSWSALSTVAQEHLHLFFVQEVASNHNKELRKLLEIGFTLSNSCVALDSCKSKRVLEESVSQLMDDRKQMLIGPSARFRSRVTSLLRSQQISRKAAAEKASQSSVERLRSLSFLQADRN